jgi:hypothetical protein
MDPLHQHYRLYFWSVVQEGGVVIRAAAKLRLTAADGQRAE